MLVPRVLLCASAFAWYACLVCVDVDASGSGVSGELRRMVWDSAGPSATNVMHACAIDGLPRVCIVFVSTFTAWCTGVKHVGFACPVTSETMDTCYIYIAWQSLTLTSCGFPEKTASLARTKSLQRHEFHYT